MTEAYSREWLEAQGFVGFTPLSTVTHEELPAGPGIYAIVRTASENPVFLETNPAGRFKGRDPTIPVEDLRKRWVAGTTVVYIGKARSLRWRLTAYRRHGAGEPVGHWGGRYVWQIEGAAELLVAWKALPAGSDPRTLERQMIVDFKKRFGRRPFGNIVG